MMSAQNSQAARSLEGRTREIGEEIFARARRSEPSIVRPEWWMNRLLDWSTADPQRKLQLFRFIDVLPGPCRSRGKPRPGAPEIV